MDECQRRSKYFYAEAHRFVYWLQGISNVPSVQICKILVTYFMLLNRSWERSQLDTIAACCCDTHLPEDPRILDTHFVLNILRPSLACSCCHDIISNRVPIESWRPRYPGGSYRLSSNLKITYLPGCDYRPWLFDDNADCPSFGSEHVAGRGWVYVNLGVRHSKSMSNGLCSRARLVAEYALGHSLRSDEHIHHKACITDDSIENIEVVTPEYHGSIHASAMCVARAKDGRFRSLDPNEDGVFPWPRNRAVLGYRCDD
jgi:hypothetical protein